MEFETALNQASVFIQCILTGLSLGLLYDIIRGIRLGLKTRKKTTLILDAVYFCLAGTILISVLYMVCGMQIRWYIVAGILIGGSLYLFGISGFVLPALARIIQAIAFIFIKILIFIAKPIIIISCVFGRKTILISKFFKTNMRLFLSFSKKMLAKCKRIGIIIKKV